MRQLRQRPSVIRPVLIASLLLSWGSVGFGQGSQVLHRKDRDVFLIPSKRLVAMLFNKKPALADIQAMGSKAPLSNATPTAFGYQQKLLLLDREANARLDKIRKAMAPFSASLGGTEIPVYDLNGVDGVLQNRVIVSLTSPIESSPARAALKELGEVTPLPVIGRNFRYLLSTPSASTTVDAANQLSARQDVAYAEPDFLVVLPPRLVISDEVPPPLLASPSGVFPDDAYFSEQWGLQNGRANGVKGADIHWGDLGSNVTGSEGLTIAILDDGVDPNHPDLAGKILSPYDEFTQLPSVIPNAWDGHGTACAGIAAAMTNNRVGIAGVSMGAAIMPIRIFRGEQPAKPTDTPRVQTSYAIIANGIKKAMEQGADVISASLYGGDSTDVTAAIGEAATQGRGGKGTVVVIAAGNDGADHVSWPANLSMSYPGVVAVGATNEWDELKGFNSKDGEKDWASNYGSELTIVAPGVHIFTTDIHGAGGFNATDYTPVFRGTSAAVPFVAGAAALLIASHPNWTAGQVRQALVDFADDLQTDHGTVKRLNICRALGQPGCG